MTGVAHVDGGSRGNPGPAGWGVLLTVGDERFTDSGFARRATNNEAEYQGLLAALELAARVGVTRLEVRTDSQLMERQLNGAYRVKAGNLQPLFLEAKRRLAGFERFRIVHVRREQNREADRLANQAMDRGTRAEDRNGGR